MASKEIDSNTERPTTFVELAGTSIKSSLDVARKYGAVQDHVLKFTGGGLYPGDVGAFYTLASELRIRSYLNLSLGFGGNTVKTWRRWIAEVGPETYQGYMSAGIPLAYIFAETDEERKELSKELKTIAKKYRGKINFATIDAKAFGQHAGNLNLEVGKWPAFAIQDTAKNQKYPFDQTKKISSKDIGEFVDKFSSGNIKPSIKSEPIPENQDGPVTIIVANNYEEIVLDENKDVLVEFYAPWCGHCKALAPKYDELGELFKPFSDLVTIAKVDATTNDVPDDIQGFPTIKLFVAGKKSDPITYSGGRTVEELAAFVKESGKHAVDVYAAKDETKSSSEPAKAAESDKPVKKSDDEIHDEL